MCAWDEQMALRGLCKLLRPKQVLIILPPVVGGGNPMIRGDS